MHTPSTLKEYRELVASMQSQRTRREAAWAELSAWICPWRGRFSGKMRDEYERENISRFTHAAVSCLLRGASGLTSGMTPRNISWFRPAFSQADLVEAQGSRAWLDALDLRIKDALTSGGFYQAIHNFNMDLIWAGCAMLYAEHDDSTALRFECLEPGTYLVGQNSAQGLHTVIRTMELTPLQLSEMFGEERLCRKTRQMLKTQPHEAQTVWQAVISSQKTRSVWWEEGGEEFLRQASYHEMPFFFTCWHEGQTPYGTGPGDDCLADARQMDVLERNKLACLGKLADPPVAAPPTLKDADLSPGGINYVNNSESIVPILDLGPAAQALTALQEEIKNVAGRLEDGLMASIFASPPLDQRPRDMSATEFLERKRETLQRLGPVISAYEPNVLIPLLFRAVNALDRMGLTPPLPPALAQQQVFMKMEFISPMANALRQSSAETARALFTDVAQIFQATQNPEIFDKLDTDQLVDELAASLGAPGAIVRSDDDVAKIREQRSQQQQQQEQMQAQLAQSQLLANNSRAAESMAKADQAIGEE